MHFVITTGIYKNYVQKACKLKFVYNNHYTSHKNLTLYTELINIHADPCVSRFP